MEILSKTGTSFKALEGVINRCSQGPANVTLATTELILVQTSSKQLISQPETVCVDNVRLTVVGDLLDAAGVAISLDLASIDPVWLALKSHDPTNSSSLALPP